MSLDQITTIFTGLRCAFDLVDPVLVRPTANDTPINLCEEARAIVFRILDYKVNRETRLRVGFIEHAKQCREQSRFGDWIFEASFIRFRLLCIANNFAQNRNSCRVKNQN
jgi:hypothetical protein